MLSAGEDWSWGYRAVFTDDVLPKLARVTCPLFFLIGRHDGALPQHLRAVERHPEHRSYISEEHGLYYSETAPEDLAPRLADFIRSVKS
jgi:pimeloyl-ACP methyl ester carboxylesterase